MKKTTSKKLASKLAQYSAMVTALGTIAESNGQVIYTDIGDFQGDNNATLNIDLNNDGTTDYTLNGGLVNTNYEQILIDPAVSNSVLATSGAGYLYPFALNEGDMINEGDVNGGNTNWYSSGGQILRYIYPNTGNDCSFTSQWCTGDIVDKYLGLRFKIGSDTHYGWIRMDVLGTNTTENWVVKDFAYQATPDTPIEAGQTLSTNELQMQQVDIFVKNKTISLKNLPELSSYRVYNLAGQTLLSGDIDQKAHSIDTTGQSTGIYILELTNANSNAVIRKKLILK